MKCEEDPEILSIPPDSPRRLSEQPDNSVDATSKLDDSIRFKREKLTEQLHVSNKESEDVRKNKIIKKKKNKNIKNRLRKKKKTLQKQQVLKTSTNNPVKSRVEEVDKTLELDQDDGGVSVHNCRDGKSLCKSFKLRKEEIGENIRLPANKDNKARIDVVVEEDDASLKRVENAGTPRPTLLIQSPVNDTSKLSEDPTLQKPIKSDSVGIQNTSHERPESPPPPVPSKLQPKLKLRTRPLDKIPFSRVVAAQKKINGQFSPYISFPELLTNLTKSQRSVRKVDNMIYLTELWTMK